MLWGQAIASSDKPSCMHLNVTSKSRPLGLPAAVHAFSQVGDASQIVARELRVAAPTVLVRKLGRGYCRPPRYASDNRARPAARLRPVLMCVLLLAGQFVSAGVVRADELIVDNAHAAVQVTGRWQASSTSPGFYGGDYLFRVRGDGSAHVNWPFPVAGSSGPYAVLARWSSGPNRTTGATYTIASDAGTTDVHVNQRIGGALWQPLGTYTFSSNRGQGVTLSDQADGIVVADAIVWVGPVTAADARVAPDAISSAGRLQRSVDEGDQPWRLDPLESARADGVALGLSASDSFQLLSVQGGVARVRAQHGRVSYDIRLEQSARPDSPGFGWWRACPAASLSSGEARDSRCRQRFACLWPWLQPKEPPNRRPTDLRLVLNRAGRYPHLVRLSGAPGHRRPARERTGTVFNTAVHVVLGRFLGDHWRAPGVSRLLSPTAGYQPSDLRGAYFSAPACPAGVPRLRAVWAILVRYDRNRSAHEGMAHTKVRVVTGSMNVNENVPV